MWGVAVASRAACRSSPTRTAWQRGQAQLRGVYGELEPDGEAVRVHLIHVGSRSDGATQHPERFRLLEAVAQCGTADAQPPGELALAGQSVAGS